METSPNSREIEEIVEKILEAGAQPACWFTPEANVILASTFKEQMLKLHQELQKAREEEVSNIIADYMEALGTVQLPQEVWLWIADINGKYLNKTLKENI